MALALEQSLEDFPEQIVKCLGRYVHLGKIADGSIGETRHGYATSAIPQEFEHIFNLISSA